MRDLRGDSRRRYLDLPWGQVHLRESGPADGPPLLMLHQSPLSSATFEAVLGPLAQRGVHAFAMDTPGFGMSDGPGRPWTVPDYAAAVWQVADQLGLTSVTLLGQHTGAVVAWEATVQQRSRVAGLVLQGIPLYDEQERADKLATYAPQYVPAADGSHLRTIWERVQRLYPALDVDETDRQVLEYLCVGPDFGQAYRAVFAHHVQTEALREHPTALLHGDGDLVHRFTPAVTAALPWAQLHVLPGGTDFAADELPEQFADTAAHLTYELTRQHQTAEDV